jgi:prolyl-tRNA synthetase
MTLEEIASVGAVAGFASPIGLSGAEVVADELVMASPNLVAGANEEGWHLLDTNAGRDWEPDLVADIISADDGDACSVCGAPLRSERGVEVGNIFKLGTRFSEAFGATYLDPDGNAKPIVMGSYGIGVGRLLACIAEELGVLFDDRGERPGVQFADADLIGLPLRLTVSERSLNNGGIELKRRTGDESRIVAEEALVLEVRAELDAAG